MDKILLIIGAVALINFLMVRHVYHKNTGEFLLKVVSLILVFIDLLPVPIAISTYLHDEDMAGFIGPFFTGVGALISLLTVFYYQYLSALRNPLEFIEEDFDPQTKKHYYKITFVQVKMSGTMALYMLWSAIWLAISMVGLDELIKRWFNWHFKPGSFTAITNFFVVCAVMGYILFFMGSKIRKIAEDKTEQKLKENDDNDVFLQD